MPGALWVVPGRCTQRVTSTFVVEHGTASMTEQCALLCSWLLSFSPGSAWESLRTPEYWPTQWGIPPPLHHSWEWVLLFPSWELTKIKRCRTLVGGWGWNHVSQKAKWNLWSAGFSGHFCHSALRPTSHLHTNHSRWDFNFPPPQQSQPLRGEFYVWWQQIAKLKMQHSFLSCR